MLYVTIPALPLFIISAASAGAFGIAVALMTLHSRGRTISESGLKKIAIILLICIALVVASVAAILITYGPAGEYR